MVFDRTIIWLSKRALAEDGQTWLRYEYDYANRLSVVKRDGDGAHLQAFQYSPSGGRLMNYDYISTEFILYANLGGTTLSEYREYASNVPTWTKSYTYLGDSRLSTISNVNGAESVEYNHPDRLGTRTITNQQSGTSSEQITLPFGTALNAESSITNNKNRFTSYDRSDRTGLDYAVNRNYDSKQGRFTQIDPIKMRAVSLSSPQTLNLYSYCGNDPINHTDPSGLFWGFFKKLIKWVMVAIAVVVAVMTIIAAPATIAGVLGAISAGAGAASQVLNAFGFKKAGMIFGLIAVATGFGSIIASKIGKGHFAEGTRKDDLTGALFGIFSGVGAISDFAQTKTDKKKSKSLNLNECNHYLKAYYNQLKPYFDRLWERTLNSKSEEAPNGKEAGGVIYISDSNVSIGGIEESGLDMYEGKTGSHSMGDEFNDWVIERQRIRGLKGYTTLVVHTHPTDTIVKPSGGDQRWSKNKPEATVSRGEVAVFQGKNALCRIQR